MKKEVSICQSLMCLDLVIYPVLSQIELQAPLLEVPFRQLLHVSGLRPCSPQKHKTPISQRARICDWTSKAKGSYLRLDIKDNTTATLIQTTCNSAGVRCGMFHDPVSLSGASDIKQLRQGVR